LSGWPADRHLRIVQPDQNGEWKAVRTYPALGGGEPIRLYLRGDGVYVAIAERGSPFGEGAQIAEPRDEQRGDSFYIALQHALFPDQRESMGLDRWNENDIDALRGKVHAFSAVPTNKRSIDELFSLAAADPAWSADIQKRMSTYRRPTPPDTPTATTAKSAEVIIPCRPSARVARIGPANPQHIITCHLYIHEDVPLGENRIVARYIQWWLDEMGALLPAHTGLQLKILHDAQGITDLDYTAATDKDALMMELYKRMDDETDRKRCPEEEHGYHLLLTGKNPQPGLEGFSGYRVAIASMGERRMAGHELGHLFGATHDGAEVRFSGGWWRQTAMYHADLFSVFRASHLGYSEANRENIRRTLAQ
jgi:hypothetical protein